MATAIVWPAPIINFFFYSFSATGLSLRLSIFLGRVVCYPSFFPLHSSIYRSLLSFSPLFLQHRWSDSAHRSHLYSSCTSQPSTHCTLLRPTINSRLTLGDRWARHIPDTFYGISMIDYRPLARNICILSRCFAFPSLDKAVDRGKPTPTLSYTFGIL